MKLWAGRFQKETDTLVNKLNSSIGFDARLYAQDIRGSIAHAAMLGKTGIIEPEESEKIVEGLKAILADIEADQVEFSMDNEDIHMNIEALLTQRIGKTGKRLHTARSRNDQVATDFRLYVKEEIPRVIALVLDLERVLVKKLLPALETGQRKSIEVDIQNTDRAFGTIFGAEITRRYPEGLSEDTFTVKCSGSGGQSFGAFIPAGLTLEVSGDSNDYFGKGLSGGKLVIYPPRGAGYAADENIIIGNVALYGATGGKAYISGVAGERFAVRNSGARAVVEGVGDHGCEYMTGGCVVVLGKTGKNFAAGMSGGIAYVLDEDHDLYLRLNKDQVMIDSLTENQDIQELRLLLEEHVAATGSERGREILAAFKSYIPCFKKIMPGDYLCMIQAIAQREGRGMSREQAEIEAFYSVTRG